MLHKNFMTAMGKPIWLLIAQALGIFKEASIEKF